MQRRLARWSLGTTLLLVTLGGYTRGSGSGFGCRDRWPLCENGLLGGLLPRLEYNMVVEWLHRWVAAIVGVLVLLTVIALWRARPRHTRALAAAVAALLVVIVQAWLGREIVQSALDRDLVALHLTVSMVVIGLLVLVVLATGGLSHPSAPVGWRVAALLAPAVAYAVLLLGSLVHDLYFAGWPLMQDGPENRNAALHLAHRLVAGAGWVFLAALAMRARRTMRPERTFLLVAAGAFTVNVVLGAVHVVTEVSSALVVALHLLFAALAWAGGVAAAARAAGWERAAA